MIFKERLRRYYRLTELEKFRKSGRGRINKQLRRLQIHPMERYCLEDVLLSWDLLLKRKAPR